MEIQSQRQSFQDRKQSNASFTSSNKKSFQHRSRKLDVRSVPLVDRTLPNKSETPKYKYAHMIKQDSIVEDREPDVISEDTGSTARHLAHSHVIDDASFVYALPFLPKGKSDNFLTPRCRSGKQAELFDHHFQLLEHYDRNSHTFAAMGLLAGRPVRLFTDIIHKFSDLVLHLQVAGIEHWE